MATALDVALEYIGFGWSPIPVPHKSKRPSGSEWQNLRITQATAWQWFNGEAQNIGVLLGEASGGLADIDLDCDEAIAVAASFFPRTRIFGRASKRFSHRLYKTELNDPVATIKFQDVQKPAKVILEIRIGGAGKAAQTIFPGSIHPSGEAIEWGDLREVSTIDGLDLKRAAARVAACTLIARAYPQQGGRHEGAIVVAGFLCRCGFSGPDVKLFVDALAGASLQPPDKRRDMVRAAADTFEAFVAGKNTFGLPKMMEVFGEDITRKCAEWLGYRAEARAGTCRGSELPENDDFIRGELGQILKTRPYNLRRAIELLGVQLRQNEFSGQTEVEGLEGRGPDFNDPDAVRLRFLVEETYGFLPGKDLFEEVLIDIAHRNRFHPVREYLAGLVWDGVPRIDNWLVVYGGAESTPFNRAVGRIFLIAGVRRVRRPGCKFDTMLVLESPIQGRNKSQAARLLAIRQEWFNDNLPLGARPQEVIEQIGGVWVFEFAELAGSANREVEHIRAFLSRQVDKARAAYGRRTQTVPRQFVAVGTTNDTEYLRNDERRFWPVRIERFDVGALERDVGQLWAEAAYYESEGEPLTLQEDLWDEASGARAVRTFENPYYSDLARRFGRALFVTTSEIWEFLSIPRDRRKWAGREVCKAMEELGFSMKQAGRDDEKMTLKRGDRYYEREIVS